MGVFDIFTGDAAEEAANKNRDNLANLKKEGMSYLDTAHNGAFSALGGALGAWNGVNGLGDKYNVAGDMYLNALGLNGQSGKDTALNAYQNYNPGFESTLNTGLDALDRRAASRGLLASGNNTLDTVKYATDLGNQNYNNWLSNISGLTSLGAQETNIGRAGTAATYGAMVPVYQNEANSRINLASNVANGINSQNTQQANAETAGSGNLWNFGMNVAKLGTSLLG